MRVKDDSKKEAIFNATIELLNEIGFAEITMSKIGKRAGVSSSTIYVYFKNKEDMLKKVYLDVKGKLRDAMARNIQHDIPMKQVVDRFVRNILSFVMEHRGYYLFIEQFANSPLVSGLCEKEMQEMFQPLKNIFEKGKKQGKFKPVSASMLMTYCYQPVAYIGKTLSKDASLPEDLVKQIIQLSWDAVKA
jgi:AcrR family transcriptional regulator